MKINNLHFSYNSNNVIFDNFHFESSEKYIFLQGYSGCGKTTLLKLLTGNLLANSGTINLEVTGKSCLILQEDALFPWLSGLDNIFAVLKGVSVEQIRSHIFYSHVESFINKYACQMSYGQRRLIELFRAILLKPSLLCLDEPFNYLDEGSRQFVSKILFSPQYLEDIARIVMTTHYESDFLNVRGIEYSLYHFNGKFPYAQLEKRK